MFTGNLKFVGSSGTAKTVTPAQLVTEQQVDDRWDAKLLDDADMGLLSMFSSSTGCTGALLDPAHCPLLRRFYSMIDRHENFYRTYSALSADYYGISSQPSPLVACSITLGASHQWDTAGTPTGGSAGFIFLMRIPFADIVTGNDTSVATLMPGPKTMSIQDLYKGAKLDMSRAWLDVAACRTTSTRPSTRSRRSVQSPRTRSRASWWSASRPRCNDPLPRLRRGDRSARPGRATTASRQLRLLDAPAPLLVLRRDAPAAAAQPL